MRGETQVLWWRVGSSHQEMFKVRCMPGMCINRSNYGTGKRFIKIAVRSKDCTVIPEGTTQHWPVVRIPSLAWTLVIQGQWSAPGVSIKASMPVSTRITLGSERL
ncbi:hypothetical protein PoB_003487000 [Plakobranchus ocellatus]|uniref:Uncharacterized protein n=1 Tax=Plakobranchus ocellatus TaxID=259542 RepID=A0AAV4AJM4_9GAST|nr:hypothetical protein PoB_003487000 [Plakobranchus ocellatus]